MSPKLILFDVDGTLVDTAGAGRVAVYGAFGEVFGVEQAALDGVRLPFAGMTDPNIFRALGLGVGLDEARYDARVDALYASYIAHLSAEMARPEPRRRVLPGVRELLSALTGVPGAHLGLLTGNLERGARIKLEPFGLNRFFEGGGFGSDAPDRRAIARIARAKLAAYVGVGFPPEDVVVVGDTDHDVDCARANGFRAVAVESGWCPRERLVALRPDALLRELTPLADALAALGFDHSGD